MRSCKPCRSSAERDRRQSSAGDRIRRLDRERNRKPERQVSMAERSAAWYQANRTVQDARTAAWVNENRERRRQISRESKRRRREALDANTRRALDQKWNRVGLARRRGAEMRRVDDRDLRRMVARQRGLCIYCGHKRPLSLDHVIPIARGGRHAIGNLVLACIPCNSSKRDRLLVEWMSRPRGLR